MLLAGGPPMGRDADYVESVAAAYQDKARAEALFAALAERTPSPERREKWRTLARLEFETRGHIAAILTRLGRQPNPDPGTHSAAEREAEALSRLRWHDLMDLLHARVTPFIARLEALERLGPALDRPALARGTAHEVALQSFVRLELAGRLGESIRPTLVLLAHSTEAPPAVAAC